MVLVNAVPVVGWSSTLIAVLSGIVLGWVLSEVWQRDTYYRDVTALFVVVALFLAGLIFAAARVFA